MSLLRDGFGYSPAFVAGYLVGMGSERLTERVLLPLSLRWFAYRRALREQPTARVVR